MKNQENSLFWYWFVNISGIGRISQKKILERFGHPEAFFTASENDCRDILTKKQRTGLSASKDMDRVRASLHELESTQTLFVHWESPAYPERLRHLYDPPYGLYVRGRLPDEDAVTLAMIGARAATRYGIEMAESFAKVLVRQGVQIVSGLAAGVDSAGHRGALMGGGYTLGILGGGIDTMYPRENFNLYRAMYERGGVMSEYNRGVLNQPGLFPERNRLISGMSDGIFVLEAGKKSGTLITVDQALEQGKDVFALPGRITDPLSAGCNALIADGARPVTGPDDILEVLTSSGSGSLLFAERKKAPPLKEEHAILYALLDEKEPKSFNELLLQSGLAMPKLQQALLEMELAGILRQEAQNTYLKKL